MKGNKIIGAMIIAFLLIFAFGLVIGGMFLSMTGLFTLIGVEFNTYLDLFLFVVYCFLIGLILEIFEKIPIGMLANTNLKNKEKLMWIIILKFILNWLVLHIVNLFMTSVTLSFNAEIITAALLVAFDIAFGDDRPAWRGNQY